MNLLENLRRDKKKKKEEKDILVRHLSSVITNLSGTKNKNLQVCTFFISSLFQ
jgi:hypothetical protein